MIYTKTLELSKLFQKKNFNSTQGKGATLLATKEQSYKQGIVKAHNVGSMKIILALPDGLRVWDGFFQPVLLDMKVF